MVKEILEKDDLRLCSAGFNTLWQTIKNSADIKDIPFINPCLNSREDCCDGQEMSVWGLNLVTVGTPGHPDGFNWDILTVAMKFGKYIHGAHRIDLKFGDPLIVRSATMSPSFCLSRWNKRELAGFCTDIHYYLILILMILVITLRFDTL